jgi:chorismate mutase
MSLTEIRNRIDRIDIEILEKLDERLSLVRQTKAFKPEILDHRREIRIIKRVREYAQKLQFIDPDFAVKIFTELIREGRRLQNEEET